MNAVTSLYIPHVEKQYNAEFIAGIFSKNGLAQVSRVFIEPYKTNINNHLNYNRAYVQIDSWHETEAAYSFIQRLRNPSTEARLVYSEDNWWAVDINRCPSKLIANNSVLTIFAKQTESREVDDSSSAVMVGNVEENRERERMEQEETDAAEYDAYLREIDWVINTTCQGITSDMFDEVFGC